jgi:transposase
MGELELDGRFDGSHRGNTYQRIELITGERRRRHWTAEEKAAILAESCQPGASISDVARRHGLNRNLLGTWRREARAGRSERQPPFVPVRVLDECATTPALPCACSRQSSTPHAAPTTERAGAQQTAGCIDIEIGDARVRISGLVDSAALRQVLKQLRQHS